jgi:hypothetical protein
MARKRRLHGMKSPRIGNTQTKSAPAPDMPDTSENMLNEPAPDYRGVQDDIDLSLLKDSLAKTPWERMLANDDALNFGETLRAAMEQGNAKP